MPEAYCPTTARFAVWNTLTRQLFAANHVDERRRKLGIELRTGATRDLGDRIFRRHVSPAAICATARHRIECVGDTGDARLHRNIQSGKFVRNAASVVTLVMRSH